MNTNGSQDVNPRKLTIIPKLSSKAVRMFVRDRNVQGAL